MFCKSCYPHGMRQTPLPPVSSWVLSSGPLLMTSLALRLGLSTETSSCNENPPRNMELWMRGLLYTALFLGPALSIPGPGVWSSDLRPKCKSTFCLLTCLRSDQAWTEYSGRNTTIRHSVIPSNHCTGRESKSVRTVKGSSKPRERRWGWGGKGEGLERWW